MKTQSSVNYDIKLKFSELMQALIRNINANFVSVSFSMDDNNYVLTKFILFEKSDIEEELIDDIMVEFESFQETNCILRPEIAVGIENKPLPNLVFAKKLV